MKLLFIGPTRIGDSILSTSILNYYLENNKEFKFTIITSSYSKDLFEKLPNLEKIIVIDKRNYGFHWYKIWASVVFKKWDLVIDMRSSAISYFLNKKKKLIFKGNHTEHKIIQFQKFLKTQKHINPKIWYDKEDQIISEEKINLPGPFIALSPFSNWYKKDWSIKKYIELFHHDFFKKYTLIISGITSEKTDDDDFNILLNHPNIKVLNLLDTGLRQMIPIFENCEFFVGSDSGLMHLAATTKCKTFALFGPTNEIVYRPWGNHRVIKAYNSSRDDDSLNLSVNQVLNVIKEEIV